MYHLIVKAATAATITLHAHNQSCCFSHRCVALTKTIQKFTVNSAKGYNIET